MCKRTNTKVIEGACNKLWRTPWILGSRGKEKNMEPQELMPRPWPFPVKILSGP